MEKSIIFLPPPLPKDNVDCFEFWKKQKFNEPYTLGSKLGLIGNVDNQSYIQPPHTYVTMLHFSAVTNSLQMLATNQEHTQSQTLIAKFSL